MLPTTDIVAIRNAYRELVKKYHPDTVLTVEEKRRYTVFCAEINEAYKEAIEWARGDAQISRDRDFEAPDRSAADLPDAALWKAISRLTTAFSRRLIIGFILLVLA